MFSIFRKKCNAVNELNSLKQIQTTTVDEHTRGRVKFVKGRCTPSSQSPNDSGDPDEDMYWLVSEFCHAYNSVYDHTVATYQNLYLENDIITFKNGECTSSQIKENKKSQSNKEDKPNKKEKKGNGKKQDAEKNKAEDLSMEDFWLHLARKDKQIEKLIKEISFQESKYEILKTILEGKYEEATGKSVKYTKVDKKLLEE